jgi:1-acyl-sn-glycerol-3-phosphate acyltransferase
LSSARTSLPVRLWRSARLFTHLLQGVATAALVLPRLSPEAREERIRQWCSTVLAILQVSVRVRGHVPKADTRGMLFVANHISWIDIWVLKAQLPMRFVSKSEIRDWPVIGWLALHAGTLFVTRHKRQQTGQTMNSVEEALRENDNLCFFPEGTTTDGTELKPFKSSLFQAAVNARAGVWPLMIFYPHPQGGANTDVAYSGDTTMLQSLCAVLSQKEIAVELEFAEPLEMQEWSERRQLAQQARQAIASRWTLRAHKALGTGAGHRDAAR